MAPTPDCNHFAGKHESEASLFSGESNVSRAIEHDLRCLDGIIIPTAPHGGYQHRILRFLPIQQMPSTEVARPIRCPQRPQNHQFASLYHISHCPPR